ncbi:VWA domain-containing protein [Vibrio sp. WXL103]|uniref:VWA domain-containing protein n=1 Tax=Vibrio sp. WXL103 TaxID=3450710 RepID=UPI003EC5A770
MHFVYPNLLWLLVPCLILCAYLAKRNRQQTLIASHIAKAMGLERAKNNTLASLLALAWSIAIIALAGPSLKPTERPSVQSSDARVVIMDMSLSMYARDISPSRLEQARFKVTDLLNQWQDGQTGLVIYAGDAYSVSPLTRDTNVLLNQLPLLSPDIMPYPGARADKAVELAISMLTDAGFQAGQIILVADDLSQIETQGILEHLDARWELAILGVATETGAPIPLPQGGMLQSSSGTTVVASSNFNNMSRLARESGGLFLPVQHHNADVAAIATLSERVNSTDTGSDRRQIETWQNQGFWLVIPLLIMALLMFRRGVFYSLPLMMLGLTSTNVEASPWHNHDQKAHQAFQNGDYQSAQQQFSDPEWLGAAAYQAGDFDTAIDVLTGIETQDAQYNLGNALAQSGQLEQAAEQYRRVLDTDPNNTDARHNLDLVERLLEEQQQSPQDNNQADDQQSQSNSSESDSSDSNDADNNQNQENQSDDDMSADAQSADAQSADAQSSDEESEQQQSDQPQSSSEQETAEQSAPEDEQSESENEAEPDSTNGDTPPEEQSKDSASGQQSLEQQAPEQQDPEANQVELANEDTIDPQTQRDLRRLDQVEAARDPSRLIRAQLQLQAQQKPQPPVTEKTW